MGHLLKYIPVYWGNFVEPVVWDRTFTAEVTKRYRISICTTVMNRLGDLQKTLLKNIADNADYPHVEFVVLDYNSSDGLGDWMRGLEGVGSAVNYYRTTEPEYYSMAHSRNIAFKMAEGEIVVNVDADGYTNAGFAAYLNRLANEQPRKAIFAKGKKMMRGRLGFYKDEFINELGGYDEDLLGYGHDDHDLMTRAWGLGYKLMWFGGQFCGLVDNHRKHQGGNYQHSSWKYTERRNKLLSLYNLSVGQFKANEGRHWGRAHLVKNFSQEIDV
uniref:Putative glycosyltransferase n=1 Tax=viral metagenome TaxID=1070528 RepID=A0A6M3ISB9_9ZZZZ